MKDRAQIDGAIKGLGVQYKTILTPGGFEGFYADMAAGQCRLSAQDLPLATRHPLA